MKLRDFLIVDATVEDLSARDKAGAIREMVDKLVEVGTVKRGQAKSVVEALLDREKLGSTGIGRGVAVPHAKHRSVDKVMGLVALSRSGVDFGAIDGEPVYVFFLLLSSRDQSAEHLQALERIATVLRDDHFPRFLKQAKNKAEIAELLAEADEKFGEQGPDGKR
jgi:nitrogen PTS system EIIA component